MRACYNIYLIVQTTGGDEYSFNEGKWYSKKDTG